MLILPTLHFHHLDRQVLLKRAGWLPPRHPPDPHLAWGETLPDPPGETHNQSPLPGLFPAWPCRGDGQSARGAGFLPALLQITPSFRSQVVIELPPEQQNNIEPGFVCVRTGELRGALPSRWPVLSPQPPPTNSNSSDTSPPCEQPPNQLVTNASANPQT